MERRQRATPQLPDGLSLDDLRFVNQQMYPLEMTMKGWEVLLENGIGGNEARVLYSLSRTVPNTLDLVELKKRIGLIDDDGNSLPGYYVGLTNSQDATLTLSRRMGISDETDQEIKSFANTPVLKEDESHLLFNFTGFPTEKTMDVLLGLEKEFLPKDFKPMHLRLLASSESMEETPRGKSFLERAKTIFHR